MTIADRPSGHVHKLVRQTALDMGAELYEVMMHDNDWYATWKARNPDCQSDRSLRLRFVMRNLSKLVPQARATLAGMLSTTTDPALRESIYNALLLDNTLTRGRAQ